MKLTRQALAALVLPAGKDDVVYWDSALPSFGCRLRSGSKTWLIQYRVGSQQRRESLARCGASIRCPRIDRGD